MGKRAGWSGVITLLVIAMGCGNAVASDRQVVVELFSPGLLPAPKPADAAPAFMPDGNTVYVGRVINERNQIVVSTKKAGRWSEAHPAPFSSEYRDLEPAIDPRGRYMIFASSRPSDGGTVPLNGRWSDADQTGKGGNLWRVDLRDPKAVPARLPVSINANSSTFSPAVTSNGTLWFMRSDDGHQFHMFRVPMQAGTYLDPVPAPFTDARYGDYDPAVAPDESFLVFSSSSKRSGATTPQTNLFVIFKTTAGWSEPLDLATAISPKVHGVEARLSPDTRTLYFTNGDTPSGQVVRTDSYIWRVRLDLPRLRRMSLRA